MKEIRTRYVQFILSSKDLEELRKMKEELGLTSMADVVRSSLRLTKKLIEEIKKGSKLLIRKDGWETEVLIELSKGDVE